MARLFVNVDHVATIREARKAAEPDPLNVAILSELAGADGITIHLREDRRHIQDHDLARIRRVIQSRLNLEMAPTAEMTRIALRYRPYQVSLVPEKRQEITTEGGLDVCAQESALRALRLKFSEKKILFSLFVDPDERQVHAAARIKADSVEINTGKYSSMKARARASRELVKIREVARLAASLGLKVFAGHGLNTRNVQSLAAIPEIEEFNIGHHIVSRAIFVGIKEAVQEMILAIRKGANARKRAQGA